MCCGEADADGHVADRVFQNQVPADDPGDQFAHGGVGIGVRAARNGDHRGELGVADRGKAANNGNQYERKRDRRACSGAAKGCGVVNQVLQQGCVQDRCDLQLLAGDRGADNREDAGADHGPDAEGRQAEPA